MLKLLAAGLFATFFALRPDTSLLKGDYVEARTCDVWVGQCFARLGVGEALADPDVAGAGLDVVALEQRGVGPQREEGGEEAGGEELQHRRNSRFDLGRGWCAILLFVAIAVRTALLGADGRTLRALGAPGLRAPEDLVLQRLGRIRAGAGQVGGDGVVHLLAAQVLAE